MEAPTVLPTVRTLLFALLVPLLLIGTAQAASSLDEHPDHWPTHEDVQQALDEAHDHSWVTVHTLGYSNEDRIIRVAEITDPNASMPIEERAVTYLLTQQHGNEPAATPAALDLINDITNEERIQETLTNQILLILPMANPDGSDAFQRTNADGIDPNRDHIKLETPEAQAMHKVFTTWDVDVFLDHHEYGGTGPGNPAPVHIHDYDLTLLYPRHGNVPAPTLDAAQDLMYEGIWEAAEQEGYSVGYFGEIRVGGETVERIAGGADPGIARNHGGLHNAASLLIESRVDAHPNPFHDGERRIHIHAVVMESTLEHVHENHEYYTSARQASQHLASTFPDDTYHEGDTQAPFHDAYRFPNATNTWETLQAHGIHPGTETTHGIVHETGHTLHGHAGALLHPESSRAITTAAPTEPHATDPDEAINALGTDDTPLPPIIALIALLSAPFLTRHHRP